MPKVFLFLEIKSTRLFSISASCFHDPKDIKKVTHQCLGLCHLHEYNKFQHSFVDSLNQNCDYY